jgi:hypothetical protein
MMMWMVISVITGKWIENECKNNYLQSISLECINSRQSFSSIEIATVLDNVAIICKPKCLLAINSTKINCNSIVFDDPLLYGSLFVDLGQDLESLMKLAPILCIQQQSRYCISDLISSLKIPVLDFEHTTEIVDQLLSNQALCSGCTRNVMDVLKSTISSPTVQQFVSIIINGFQSRCSRPSNIPTGIGHVLSMSLVPFLFIL